MEEDTVPVAPLAQPVHVPTPTYEENQILRASLARSIHQADVNPRKLTRDYTTRKQGRVPALQNNLVLARRLNGMTRSHAAAVTGVVFATLERWEQGICKIDPAKLGILEMVYGYPIGWLLPYTGLPVPDGFEAPAIPQVFPPYANRYMDETE